MPDLLKLVINYLTLDIGYNKIRTDGLFRYNGLTAELLDTSIIIFIYVLFATVFGTLIFIFRYFFQIETMNFFIVLAFIIEFMSERGHIKEDGLPASYYLALLIRSVVKLTLLLITYSVLVQIVELIS